jgi:hypothetical protein
MQPIVPDHTRRLEISKDQAKRFLISSKTNSDRQARDHPNHH